MNSDVSMDLLRLAGAGFNCSQILIKLGLELQHRDNSDLVRAVTGLGHGMGFCGETCGALTGGICLISLYAGKGTAEEQPHHRFELMIAELVEWFRDTVCAGYGGIRCADILSDTQGKTDTGRCGDLVQKVYAKVMEILTASDIDPSLAKD
ncbi:DVU_1555 family C-GCAxxG-C-C protein [Desulfofustis glycolicus]|uniref:C_GCAxxG_C_C family probable redox protein n=1 Tax=Desulfofustis glycolicus DSM 9705 TaxID=1121409 RepID=A0A1M5YHS9_9BACT|nr:DV_1555 family C-GCAxxG-C-C protein [Desulfofustis glycolicus]MCB2214819.1 C-GCAxxG-C-C family protein [Desulfobulbaceae bacterium]SHI11576.1 C_GCAxxG_C_C family probable redox protein [Desulfofustis glycolicus DSM 9705]